MDPLPLDVPAAGNPLGTGSLMRIVGKNMPGRSSSAYGTLWRQVFTRSGLLSHPGLQADLAVACRVDPDAGYDTLREWGESMRGIAAVQRSIRCLLPAAGWRTTSRNWMGKPARAMLGPIV